MTRLVKQLGQLDRRDAIDIVGGIAKIGLTALSCNVMNKALRVSVDSYVNVLTGIISTIKNV